MDKAILFMGGVSLLVVGASFLFRATLWNNWLEQVETRGQQASLTFGSINLLIGTFIVAFHPVWDGPTFLLTIIGIIALVKGMVYLIFPAWLPLKLRYIHTSEKPLFQIAGVAFILIGLILINEWWILHRIDWYDIWGGSVELEHYHNE